MKLGALNPEVVEGGREAMKVEVFVRGHDSIEVIGWDPNQGHSVTVRLVPGVGNEPENMWQLDCNRQHERWRNRDHAIGRAVSIVIGRCLTNSANAWHAGNRSAEEVNKED